MFSKTIQAHGKSLQFAKHISRKQDSTLCLFISKIRIFSTLVSLELSVAIENKSDTISLARSSFNFGANASLKILNFFSNIRSRYFLRNTQSKMQMTLHKICQNTGFSLTRILPYKDRIYDLIFLDCLEVRC